MPPSHLGRGIEKALDKLIRDDDHNDKFWKEKKVIPANDWLKMIRSAEKGNFLSLGKVMRYIPDDHVEYFLSKSVPEDKQEAWNNWWKYYIEFLEHKKNAKLGAKRCKGCLIRPSESNCDFQRLRPIILKTCFEEAERPEEKCQVHNYFICPHAFQGEKLVKVDRLFGLESLRKNLLVVMEYHRNKTGKYDDFYNTKYSINFETQSFAWSWNDGGKARSPKGSLNDTLDLFLMPKPKRPDIEIRRVVDMYRVLTDANQLKKATLLLLTAKTDEEIAQLTTIKDREYLAEHMTNYFMESTSKATLEDLRSWYGHTAEYEMQNGIGEPPKLDLLKKCTLCVDFATVSCANCGADICSNHWKEHGTKVHNWNPIS